MQRFCGAEVVAGLWLKGTLHLRELGEDGDESGTILASVTPLTAPKVPDHPPPLQLVPILSSLLEILHFTYHCLQFP